MKALALAIVFLTGVAALIESRPLHLSDSGQFWIGAAAVLAFFALLDSD